MYRASSSGTPYSIEFRIRVPDGSERLIYKQAEVTLDNDNCPVRIFGTLQDITARKRTEDAEREQRNLAEALRDTALALTTLDNLDELLDRILVQVARVVPYDSANVVLLEDGVAHLVRCRGYQDLSLETEMLKLRYTLEEVPLYRRMAEAGASLAIADTRLDPNWVPFPDSDQIRSYVSSLIRVSGEVVGFLNLTSATPGAFTDVQAERLQTFASQAAVAIQNVRLYEAVREYAAELEQRVLERTAELVRANERLQGLDELKTKFIADVSH